ncbi:unnamed protein product [Tenebrio molitor]|nr:unnamed protein product [Tenebrio molitor]
MVVVSNSRLQSCLFHPRKKKITHMPYAFLTIKI